MTLGHILKSKLTSSKTTTMLATVKSAVVRTPSNQLWNKKEVLLWKFGKFCVYQVKVSNCSPVFKFVKLIYLVAVKIGLFQGV